MKATCEKCGKAENVSRKRFKEILQKKKENPSDKWICTDCYVQRVQRIVIFAPRLEDMGLEPEDFTN